LNGHIINFGFIWNEKDGMFGAISLCLKNSV